MKRMSYLSYLCFVLMTTLTTPGCLPRTNDALSEKESLLQAPPFKPLKTLRLDAETESQMIKWNLKDYKRLIMQLEHQGRRRSHLEKLEPLTGMNTKLFHAPINLVKADWVYETSGSKEYQATTKRRLGRWVGFEDPRVTGTLFKIPQHPTATRMPHLLSYLSSLCPPVPSQIDSQLTVFPTMSRSLWVPDHDDGLYTVKIPTNVVESRVEDDKLEGTYDPLWDQVLRINELAEKTHILRLLSEHGILPLTDSAGVNIRKPNDKTEQSYSLTIRSYDKVISTFTRERKPMILMPRQTLNRATWSASNTSGEKLLYIPINEALNLEITKKQALEVVEELHRQVAAFMAVFHANGYRYLFLHDQNAMVGLQMNPLKVTLVVRDLGDVADRLVSVDGQWQIEPLGSNEVGLSRAMSEFQDTKTKKHLQGVFYDSYIGTLTKLGLTLPPGYHFRTYREAPFVTSLISNKQFASHFVPQIKSIRKNGFVEKTPN